METEGGRNPRKVKKQREQTLSKLVTIFRWLVTTVAALWGVQDIARKRGTGLPSL